jgi:hypothetical protein
VVREELAGLRRVQLHEPPASEGAMGEAQQQHTNQCE